MIKRGNIMQEVMKKYKMEDPGKINCKNCTRNIVCTLYRGISTLIKNNWSPEAEPFHPENTAMICKYFTAEVKENL